MLYDKDKNKMLMYVYISIIALMIIVNVIGNVLICIKSEKEENFIRTSLEEYENMDPIEADERVEMELQVISKNIKNFLCNVLLEVIVAFIVSVILTFMELINKGIVKVAEADYTYSDYSVNIITVSRIVAVACVFLDAKCALEEFTKYKQLLSYYDDIFYSLFGLLANIQKQFIR